MKKSYNRLKPTDNSYLSFNTMKSVLVDCTINEVAVVEIDFYEKVGDSYIHKNDKSDFYCNITKRHCTNWKDFVFRCNNSANYTLNDNDANTFCTYQSEKDN